MSLAAHPAVTVLGRLHCAFDLITNATAKAPTAQGHGTHRLSSLKGVSSAHGDRILSRLPLPSSAPQAKPVLDASRSRRVTPALDGLLLDADRLDQQLLALNGAAIVFSVWRRGMPAVDHDGRLDSRRLVGNPDLVWRHRGAADGERRRALWNGWIQGAAGDGRGGRQCRRDCHGACLHAFSLVVRMVPGDVPVRTVHLKQIG